MLKVSQNDFKFAARRRAQPGCSPQPVAASRRLGPALWLGCAALVWTSCSTLAGAAEVYKWIDDSGVTHYSARPPDNSADYEEIHVQGQLSQRSRPSAVTEALEDDEAEDEGNSDDERLTKPGAEVSVKNPDKVAANCNRARQNIETIQSRRRVSLSDGNGGQRRLNDDERLALLAESQGYLDRWCRDN